MKTEIKNNLTCYFSNDTFDIKQTKFMFETVYAFRTLAYLSSVLPKEGSDNDISLELDATELGRMICDPSMRPSRRDVILKDTFKMLQQPIMMSSFVSEEVGYEWNCFPMIMRSQKVGGVIKVVVSKECCMLMKHNKGFFQYDYNIIKTLESPYSVFIYHFLKCYFRMGWRSVSLNDLLEVLGLDKTKSYMKEYTPRYLSNVKNRIFGVDGAGNYVVDKDDNPYGLLYMINTHSDIFVTVDFKKNRVGEYCVDFEIKKNPNYNHKIVNVQDKGKSSFREMIGMVKEQVSKDIFKFFSRLKFDKLENNCLYLSVPNKEYVQELESNKIAFMIYKVAFNTVFIEKGIAKDIYYTVQQ